MAGVAGRSGAWNKRGEWDFRELLKLSGTELVRLGKKYAKAAGKPTHRLYMKWLDISLAICLKAMPTKVHGEGFDQHKHFTIIFPSGVKIESHDSNGITRQTVLPQEIPS